MTEADAKTKWCPFARFTSASNYPSSNRWKQSLPEGEPYALNPVPCRCIGSDCMAWRTERDINGVERGYCGLAGKPGGA